MSLADRVARIAELEQQLAVARDLARRAPEAHARAVARRTNLRKAVAELERHVARRKRGRRRPFQIRNLAALLVAVVGLGAFVTGMALQVRLFESPLAWVRTSCAITESDDGKLAVPQLRTSATFTARAMPEAGRRVPCWIPSSAVGDAIGRIAEPEQPMLSLVDKLRLIYIGLALGGLAAIGLTAWAATEPPAKDD